MKMIDGKAGARARARARARAGAGLTFLQFADFLQYLFHRLPLRLEGIIQFSAIGLLLPVGLVVGDAISALASAVEFSHFICPWHLRAYNMRIFRLSELPLRMRLVWRSGYIRLATACS